MGAAMVEQIPQGVTHPVGRERHPFAHADGSSPVVEAKSQKRHGAQSDQAEKLKVILRDKTGPWQGHTAIGLYCARAKIPPARIVAPRDETRRSALPLIEFRAASQPPDHNARWR